MMRINMIHKKVAYVLENSAVVEKVLCEMEMRC